MSSYEISNLELELAFDLLLGVSIFIDSFI